MYLKLGKKRPKCSNSYYSLQTLNSRQLSGSLTTTSKDTHGPNCTTIHSYNWPY